MKDYLQKGPYPRNRALVRVSERTQSTGWYSYGNMDLGRAVRVLGRFTPGSWIHVVLLGEVQPSELEGDVAEVVQTLRAKLDAKETE